MPGVAIKVVGKPAFKASEDNGLVAYPDPMQLLSEDTCRIVSVCSPLWP